MMLSLLEQRQSMGPLDDFWYRPAWWGTGGNTKEATPNEAMGLSAWYNAITINTGTIASLPLRLYRRDGEDRIPAREDPRFWMMFRKPTPWHTAFEWREFTQGHVFLRGNAYNRKIRDRMGRTVILEPLHPDRVQIETKAGRLNYRVTRSGRPAEDLSEDEMFHIRGLGADGVQGYSVVEIARRSLGYALSLEKHGSEIMGNKARPGGVVSTDQILKKETKAELAEAFTRDYTAGGIGRTLVLDAGLNWQQVGMNSDDAQFLESRQFQITEIARWTNLQPHLLKDLERATFSNIEQQSLEFVLHHVRPWAERWEQRANESLLDEDEREELFFKFDLNALLRGDSQTRAAFYKALFEMGAFSPNDIRRKEDMNGVEGGDQRFVQLNLVPLEQASDPMGSLDASAARALAEIEGRGRPQIEDRGRHLEARSFRLRRRLMETHQQLFVGAASRIVRRETQDLRRLLDAVDEGDVEEFFRRLDIWAEGLPDVVRSVMGPLVGAYISLVAEAASEEIDMEDLDGVRVDGWRDAHIDSMAQGHTSETVGRIRGTMEAEGDPWANATAMLDRWDEQRAENIGQREAVTVGAGIAVAIYNWGGFGAVWRKVGETCAYCSQLDGRTVRPGGRFLSEGEALDPGDGTEPLRVGRNIGHPQAHDGCDCFVSAWRG